MAKAKFNADNTSDNTDVLGYVGDYCIQRLSAPENIEVEWKELQKQQTASIYQNYDWVKIACSTIEKAHEVFIVFGRNKNGIQFILPMALEGSYYKTLRWIGGSHTNICSGLYSEEFLKSSNKSIMRKLFRIIAKSIEGIAQTKLVNQPAHLKSYENPLLHLGRQNSVNNMYDMDLRDGLDAILDQGSGKRKRKLWRKQNRVAESMGGYELVTPTTPDAILEAVDEFMILKGKRLHELGVRNVFSDKDTIDFFFQLATHSPIEDGNLFRIFQLKIQNKTRAMYAIGIQGKRTQAYVNAVEYDDFSDHSPGEMILYAMIERLIEESYEYFDLGVGDERYKRSWCPGMHPLFDTNVPLSPYAVPIIFGSRMKNIVKRYARNNPNIWLKFKKLRKIKAALLPRK